MYSLFFSSSLDEMAVCAPVRSIEESLALFLTATVEREALHDAISVLVLGDVDETAFSSSMTLYNISRVHMHLNLYFHFC